MSRLFLCETVRQVAVHTLPRRKRQNSVSASATKLSVGAPIMLCSSEQKLTSTSMIGRCFGKQDISHRSLQSTGGHHTHTCHTHIFLARCILSRWLIGRSLWRRDRCSYRPSSRPHTHTHLTHTHPVLRTTDRVKRKSVTEVNLAHISTF